MQRQLQRIVQNVSTKTGAPVPLISSVAVVGLALAASAAGKSYRMRHQILEDPANLSVMTWNVLARPYTKYNRKFHRNSDSIESDTQTRTRYTIAGEEIVNRSADLVLLQECESEFFETQWNLAAEKVLRNYDLYPCRIGANPGTAVLVRRGGRAVVEPSAVGRPPLCVGGSEEAGGYSKVATVLPVRVGPKPVTVVSTHFTWDGEEEKRLHHATLIGSALGDGDLCVVLGGDFNAQPGPSLEALESKSFLGKLKRASLADGHFTGLKGDFSEPETIDHIFASPDLKVLSAVALAKPVSPWAGAKTRPAKVSGASDHVPVLVEFQTA